MRSGPSKGVSFAIMMLLALSGAFLAMPLSRAAAATNIVAAYTTASIPINGVVTSGEWTATPTTISAAGMTVTFEQNSTGLLFLMQWTTNPDCADKYCFGGIEMGNASTTGNMGSSSTPTIMVLVSQSFTLGYDEFVSTGEQTPATVESLGYTTQSTCAETVSGSAYTAECYRPFTLSGATPYDPFITLVQGSPIDLGFAVGEFNQPGTHNAVGIGTYTLTLSQPPVSSTTSTTTTSTTTSTTSTTTSSHSTTSSTTSSTSSPSTSSTQTTSTSTTTTTTTSTSSAPSSSTTTTTTSATSTSTSSSTTSTSTTSTASKTSTTSTSTTSSTTTGKALTVDSMSMSLYKGDLLVYAILTTSTSGSPIAGATVTFSVGTDFGTMQLGTSETAKNGSAMFITPALSPGWTAVYSAYAGTAKYNATSAGIVLNATTLAPASNSNEPYVSGQNKGPDLRVVGVPPITGDAIMYFFLTVLGCVYFTLIFVVVRTVRIRRRTSIGNQ